MKLDVKHFKAELGDYKYLEEKLKVINDAILELETKRGVHAVRYDKESVQGSRDPLMVSLAKLNDTEKSYYLESNKNYYKRKLGRLDDFIRSTSYGTSIKKIHCLQSSTYRKEADKLGYSTIQLKRIVSKEIMNYLSKDDTEYTNNQ